VKIERLELEEKIREAMEKFRLLTVEKQREIHRAQRRSWVLGETLLAHPEMSREDAEKLLDGIVGY
jgi:hypothetical protein